MNIVLPYLKEKFNKGKPKINMSNIIQISLGFAAVLFIILCGVVWINRGSQQSLELLKPIIGGLGVALFFLIGYFFSSIPEMKYKTHIMIVSYDNGDVVSFENWLARYTPSGIFSGYRHIKNEALSFKHKLSKKEINSLRIDDLSYYLDLVEWSTFSWIASCYPNHWQIDREWANDLSGGGGFIGPKRNAYKKTEKINIIKLLKNNRFAKQKSMAKEDTYIYLPQGTKAYYEKTARLYRSIILENSHVIIKITFEHNGGGQVGASKLADFVRNGIKQEIYEHRILVSFDIKIKRWCRWSTLTEHQMKWAQELCGLYDENFSWDVLRNKLDNLMFLEKVDKIDKTVEELNRSSK